MDKTTFDLEATSAAIIFNQDMGVELILPKMSEEDVVSIDDNQNIFVAMAIVTLADDPKFREFVSMRMKTMLDTAEALAEDEKNNPPITPCGSCSGECCDLGGES